MMTIDQLEQRLESHKRGLMFFAGVALTLLGLAVTVGPQSVSQFWSWYLFWMITQLAVTPVGCVFLVSKDWRQLPLSDRLNTAFGYLAVAWLLLLSFLVKSSRDGSVAYNGGAATLMLYTLVVAAIGLAYSYWRLRTDRGHSLEEMFP